MGLGKKILSILALVLLLVVIGGCNKTDLAQVNTEDEVKNEIEIVIPEESPALMGRVKEIIGNEITIYKMDIPFENAGNGEKSDNIANLPKDEISENKTAKGAEKPIITTTGETETFLIPVGTTIIQKQRGSGEPTIIELSEIQEDQMISVWKENDTIVLVQVMGIGASRSGGNQGSNNGPGDFPPGGVPGGLGGPM